MQVTQVTSLDIRGPGAGPTLSQAVQERGSLGGTLLQIQSGGRAIVDTPAGRFSLLLNGTARPGQTLTFTIANNALQAQLGPAPADAPVLPALSSRPSLESALENLGIARTESTLAIARALIRAGIPLNAGALQMLESVLGPLKAGDEDALAFLLSRGAPASKSIIAQLANAQPGSLVRLIDALTVSRESLLNLFPSGEKQRQFQEMLIRIIGAPVSVGGDADVIGEHIERLLQNSGFDLEKVLVRFFGGGKGPNATDGALLAGQNLKMDLLLLQQLLQEALLQDPNSPQASRLRELLGLIDRALSSVESMQLSALPAPVRDTPHPVVLFLPIVVDEQTSTLMLAVDREGTGRGGEGERVRVTVQIDLTQLGPMRIILDVEARRLDVRLEVQDEETRGFVAAESDELTKRLDAAGYRVTGVLAAVARGLSFPGTLFGPALGRESRGIQGLDVRA